MSEARLFVWSKVALAVSTLSLCALATAGGAPAGVLRQYPLGPGGVVRTALGGQIFGWDINQNGTDGVLTESLTTQRFLSISAVETFDQTTGRITKVVAKQRSVSGNRELVVAGIVANDVGLIDDERDSNDGRNDVFHSMVPVADKKFTGMWTPPKPHDLLLGSVADQQTDPLVAIFAVLDYIGGGPEVLVSDVANNTVKYAIKVPTEGQTWYGPQIVAQDVNLSEAIVGAQSTSPNEPDFIVFDLKSGAVSTFLGVADGFGPIEGLAIDSSTDTMCTATGVDDGVEFYNLKTEAGFEVHIPGAGGELQSGAAIASDQVNRLFLVTQPVTSVSPSGGSSILVYNEAGTLVETLNGFAFDDATRIEVNSARRTGYVNGPRANELQAFTY